MRPHAAALLAALALAPSLVAQPRGEATVLRLRYAPGVARYTARSVQTSGTAEALRTVTTAVVSVETRAVSGGGDAQQRMRFERLSVEAPGLSAAARDRVTRALAGASVTYTQSARGEVTARAAEVEDVTLRPVVDALLQSLDQVTPRLPEAAVRVGDAWTDARTLRLAPVPGTDVDLRCETEFTLRALRPDGAAVLGLRVTLATPEGARLAGVPFRAEGAATGEAVVDLPRGLVRESRNRGELAVRLTVRGRAVDLPSRFENEVRAEPRAR